MKKLCFFSALILMIPFLSFAQSNYKAGYVVTLKGDTIKGFIDYREWDMSPDAINFKRSLTDNSAVKYGPGDIRYFGVGIADAYKSYTGLISTNPTDPAQVSPEAERDTSFRTGTVFLKVMEEGKRVALYSYKDDLKLRYFIAEAPDFKIKELILRITRTTTENTYQKQLSATAMRNNELDETMEALISRSEYGGSNLLEIVSRINHISKAELKKTHYSGSSFGFFVGAGVNSTTTAPNKINTPYYDAGGTSYTSYLPFVSLGVNVFVNPATKKLQFRLEFSAAESKYQSLYMNKVTPYVPAEATYDKLALSASPQIIYNFYNAETFKIFVGVGFVFSSYKYTNSYYGSQSHDNSLSTETANNPFDFNTVDNTFLGKAGIQFTKNLAFYVCFQSTVADTQGGYFKLSSTNKTAGLNFFF